MATVLGRGVLSVSEVPDPDITCQSVCILSVPLLGEGGQSHCPSCSWLCPQVLAHSRCSGNVCQNRWERAAPTAGAGREHGNDGPGQLTVGLEHSDFVHLGLGHVEHQLVLGEEVPGRPRAQRHQGHVLHVWGEQVWPETQAPEPCPPLPTADHPSLCPWLSMLHALSRS